ncbi:MAG TPA: hypothetical protein VNF68_06640 [Candidatus Baltobacteraceae bacterium]|nr:hypothetical protein [Candidatus Baltobacteraceae bacterium]
MHVLRHRFIVVLATCALLSTGVARAAGQSPVALNSCNLIFSGTGLAATVSGLDAQFTNNSNVTASVVNIEANIDGSTQLIRDKGTFSPGIEIHHRYRSGGEQFALPVVLQSIFGSKPQVSCKIGSVQFVDGSRWPSAAEPAQPSAIQITPTIVGLTGAGAAHAALALASGGGPLAMQSNCGPYAAVEVLASTTGQLALRVTPKAPGSCSITIRDENDNVATLPVTVQ